MTKGKKAAPTTDKRCGTRAGYAAHGRRGERPCSACKQANAKRSSSVRRQSKAVDATSEKEAPAQKAPVSVAAVPRVGAVPAGASSEDGEQVAAPAYLKKEGRALWESVNRDYVLSPAALVLLGEACRISDRLERMAAALASQSTLWFELGDAADGAEELGVPIVVNGMIGESRQLLSTLRQTLSSMGVVVVDAAQVEEKRSILDELKARREERMSKGAGA